jgi:hypothetical protein
MQQPEAYVSHAHKVFDQHGKLINDDTPKFLQQFCAGVCELGRDDPISGPSLTVLSTFGIDPAAAFNRDWQQEDILNAGFEKLFELNRTPLVLDEALRSRHAQLFPPEPCHERPIQTTAVGTCIGHPGHG